jgi:hypothetical protein
MSIKTTIEETYAILTPDEGEDLQSILSYISQNIDLWKDKDTLWDIRTLSFRDVSSEALREFTEKIQQVTKVREGLKTALVVDNDLSFGMTRMFQLQYNEKVNIKAKIFMDRDEAFIWLTESS